MNNDIEKDQKDEWIKEELERTKYHLVAMYLAAIFFISIIFISKEMFLKDKTLYESFEGLLSYIKLNWIEIIVMYTILPSLFVYGHSLHQKIKEKEGVLYKIMSVIAALSMLYVGSLIFVSSLESLIKLYSDNFKLWISIMICLAICCYYFMIEKNIFK